MRNKIRFLWPFLLLAGVMVIFFSRPSLAQEEKLDLTLRLIPDHYYNEVTVGDDNIFFLEVRNSGEKTITNIRLSSDGPEGWIIEFHPAKIDYLSPGNYQTVDINIRPAGNTSRGDYKITIIAEANEIRKVENIWVTVKTSPFWLWVGIGVTIIIVGGFVFIFMYYRKRS